MGTSQSKNRNAGKNSGTVAPSAPAAPAQVIAPEKHELVVTPSASFGKPENLIDAAALAAQEAAARQSLIDHAAPSAAPAAPATVIEKTVFENAMSRLGMKSAREISHTDSTTDVSAKMTYIAKLVALTAFVTIVSVDTAAPENVVMTLKTQIVLDSAKSHVKAARVAGVAEYAVATHYIPVNVGTSVNAVAQGLMMYETGKITLVNGVEITVGTFEKSVEKKGKTAVRKMVYATVYFADGSNEKIVSYWIQGLMSAIRSRKVAIVAAPAAPSAPENTVS